MVGVRGLPQSTRLVPIGARCRRIVTITDVPGVLPARELLNELAVESMPPVVAAATVSDEEDEG
jgi:hypothetical protein